MLKLSLGSDDTFLVLTPRGADLGAYAQVGLLALLLLVPLGLILWLSRHEVRLISRGQAISLLIVRLLILTVLWCAVGLQPHLADIYVVETPGRVRIAVDLSTSMDVTDLHEALSRKQIVRKIPMRSIYLASILNLPHARMVWALCRRCTACILTEVKSSKWTPAWYTPHCRMISFMLA